MFELDVSEQEKGTAMSREDIKFPFKHQNIRLPNNYAQAEKRLNVLKRRLKADDTYYADYCSFMSDIISKGYACKVDDEFKDQDSRTWYLQHHGIYHPQKSKV